MHSKNTVILPSLFILLVAWTFPALAEQSAMTTKDTSIHQSPSRGSDPVANLESNTPLSVMSRKGGWYLVKLDDQQTGWIPLLNVRFQSKAEDDTTIADILRQTAEMPTSAGVTSGVRGMTDEKLKQQNNDTHPFDQLEQFVPSSEQQQQFKENGGLKGQDDIPISK